MSGIKTVFIVGPTASGKTELGIKLAKEFNGEIISADSMQIYKNISIASAVPTVREMCGIKHYLLEFLEPESDFSVADYVSLARKAVKEINGMGKLPIVVGGTGLYINSLADNIAFTDEPENSTVRQELSEQFFKVGGEEMLSMLSEIDPDTAAKLHPSDKKRIIRAFEVYRLTGKTITQQKEISRTGEKLIEPCLIGITYRDRQKLYERINRRVDIMLEKGLEEEAKKAYKRNGGGAFQAIGHKELFGYFSGECTLEEAVESLKMQTRRYAKRQLTWFNKDKRIHWIYADEEENVLAAAEKTVKEFSEKEDADCERLNRA